MCSSTTRPRARSVKADVGPRSVTREHLDVPPNPPYAATVKCPKCGEIFEVIFRD